MGLIGMAFGLGFIFGPAIGGVSLKYLGITGPGMGGSRPFGAANFLSALAILPESRTEFPKKHRNGRISINGDTAHHAGPSVCW